MLTQREIGWVAGIVEGEGNIAITNDKTPVVAIKMCDKDVIEKLAKLFKMDRIVTIAPRDKNHRMQYQILLSGKKAAGWLYTIYSLMGHRRKAKIIEVMSKWILTRNMLNPLHFNCGHPRTSANIYYNKRSTFCIICVRAYQKRNYDLNKRRMKYEESKIKI